jgi:putative spermidine/putrescine transport system permease protein
MKSAVQAFGMRKEARPGRPRFLPRGPAWLFVPAVLVVVVVFVVPLVVVLVRSLTSGTDASAAYSAVFGQDLYVSVLRRTVFIALVTTAVTLLLGYPYAYLAATTTPRARAFLLALIISPFLVSLLVRTYGWLVLLDVNGLSGWLLRETGISDKPPQLVHNRIGVLIGLVQYSLPLMVLPIYAAMRQYDQRLSQAAHTLGAGPFTVMSRIYFPLTLPGVVAGSAIVFVITLGYFIVPAILGGAGDTMLGQLIAQQVTTTLNWALASALATVLLVAALIGFAIFYRYSEGRHVMERTRG